MKNKKLIGLLTIASCVVLSGCEGKVEDPVIKLADLPAVVEINDVVDLSNYVTVYNAKDYTVELDQSSKAYATLSGKKITVKGEGQIKFTVKAEDVTQDASFVGGCELRTALARDLGGAGRDYTMFDCDIDDDGYLEVSSVMYHNDNYFLTTAWDEDDEGNDVAGGVIDFGDHEYMAFTLDEDEYGDEEVVCDGQIMSDSLMERYNCPFPIDFSTAIREEDDGEVSFSVTGEDAGTCAETLFMGNDGGWDFVGLGHVACSKVTFYPYNMSSVVDKPCYGVQAIPFIELEDEGEIKEYYVGIYIISAAPGDVGYDAVDAVAGDITKKPEGKNYLTNDGVPNAFGYTSSYPQIGYVAYSQLSYGWRYEYNGQTYAMNADSVVDQAGTTFAQMAGFDGYFCEDFPDCNYNLKLYGPNGTLALDPSTFSVSSGYVQNTVAGGEGEDDITTVYSVTADGTLTADDQYETIYDRYNDYYVDLADVNNYPADLAYSREISQDNSGYVYVDYNLNMNRQNALLGAVLAGDPNTNGINSIINQYLVNYGLDLRDYFDGTVQYCLYQGQYFNYVDISFKFTWETGIYYLVDLYITVDSLTGDYGSIYSNFMDGLTFPTVA